MPHEFHTKVATYEQPPNKGIKDVRNHCYSATMKRRLQINIITDIHRTMLTKNGKSMNCKVQKIQNQVTQNYKYRVEQKQANLQIQGAADF